MHQKHAKLARPAGGKFHKLELGFLGAPCDVIQNLCKKIADNTPYSFGYIDAIHGEGEAKNASFDSILIDKIAFQSIDSTGVIGNSKPMLAHHHAVLINGNHFKSDRQILIINEKKRDSLFRKMDRIDKVEFMILDGVSAPFDFSYFFAA